MKAQLRSELLKLRTSRSTRRLAAAGLPVALLIGIGTAATAGDAGNPAPGSVEALAAAAGVSVLPGLLALLLGVLLAAGEHQHGTITTTYLLNPRRPAVLVAKAAAAALTGAGVAAVMCLTALGAAVAWTVGVDAAPVTAGAAVAGAVGGTVAAGALLGMLGVGLGAALRGQTAALVLVGCWVTIAEGVLSVVLGAGAIRWFPGGVATALTGGGDGVLGRPVAGAVLAGWTLVLLAGTALLEPRRDLSSSG